MTGTTWITESGFLEGPIMITNTNSVGVVRDAVLKWYVKKGWYKEDFWYTYPVVAETYDGFLNDIYGFHVKEENAFEALDSAKTGFIKEGNVGGGTGMMCLGFKGGTGTASRIIKIKDSSYTVGVLVQSNFGSKRNFTIAGVPVGQELKDTMNYEFKAPPSYQAGDGSIIVVVATDAPLLPHQLKRIAARVPLGVGLVGYKLAPFVVQVYPKMPITTVNRQLILEDGLVFGISFQLGSGIIGGTILQSNRYEYKE